MIRSSVPCLWFMAALFAPVEVTATARASEPVRRQWQVEGTTRDALVYVPSKDSQTRAPVVFGFHGHGGTAPSAARSFQLQRHWPEALVVYMQGIPTPGRLSDPEGKRPGWQHDAGDHGDRDLKFFDAVLAALKKDYAIDEDRVYATGHSNGGAFTYLLWAQRPDVFAAFAPSSAGFRAVRTLKPKPALHVAGENDELVKLAGQQRVMRAVRDINGCEEQGKGWGKGCLLYASRKNAPFVSFIHPGGHQYPAEAAPIIVKFFKEHTRKAPPQP